MGQGLGQLAPLLPLLGLLALVITAVRRRREKKARFAEKPSKTTGAGIALTALFGALFVPEMGVALALEKCNRSPGSHHLIETGYEQVQKGLIAYERAFFSDGEGAGSLNLVACRSGKSLRAHTIFFDGAQQRMDRRVHDAVLASLRASVASDATKTFEDLAQDFEALGAPTEIFVSNEENCGCAAVAPLARGAKQRFELESWNR